MNNQPEALRLAEAHEFLANQAKSDEEKTIIVRLLRDSATELRRLHEVNAELLAELKIARRELHACQAVMHLSGYGFDPAYVDGAKAALKTIDAAIAKATGEQA